MYRKLLQNKILYPVETALNTIFEYSAQFSILIEMLYRLCLLFNSLECFNSTRLLTRCTHLSTDSHTENGVLDRWITTNALNWSQSICININWESPYFKILKCIGTYVTYFAHLHANTILEFDYIRFIPLVLFSVCHLIWITYAWITSLPSAISNLIMCN